jgi:hypothetical protein
MGDHRRQIRLEEPDTTTPQSRIERMTVRDGHVPIGTPNTGHSASGPATNRRKHVLPSRVNPGENRLS